MTSSQIRQSFLDFFKSKQHTIVPSSSLMPDSPNLLFTNAGMNQFVPIFLGQVKCPYNPPRAADTQKCIRAGGKHNDLDDVGLDTYHHTFFEMLGNWSFGDYFKKEAIDWAWELVTEIWKFPKNRLYATVYSPDKSKNDPSDFDQEAYDFWAAKFTAAGLDPKIHIVYGNKKDNFWMMGETGPCGPCSELHVDLTPAGDTKGSLVNKGDARCMEIWNLVFIQFNANPDGTFSPLPAKHVDTGMGFERATSIIQCTKNFTDFTGIISNYETDIFRPIFDALEKMSGKKYHSTLPKIGDLAIRGSTGDPPVPVGDPPTGTERASYAKKGATASGARYSRRNLPHFEKPWAIYHVIFNTIEARKLSAAARDVVFDCILHWRELRYRLVAASVLPDHVHMIIQPGIKEEDPEGKPVFWPLDEILHSIKSYSAKEINKLDNVKGTLWQQERYDRYMRGDADLQEKFHYVCRNPWAAGLIKENEPWPWLWTPDIEAGQPYVPLSQRKGSTGDPPVPIGDPPTGTGRPSHYQTGAGLSSNDSSHSVGSTGDSPVPIGDSPTGTGKSSHYPTSADLPLNAPPHSVGSTGDPPVPVGDPPTGTEGASYAKTSASFQPNDSSHSAGPVARQHGQVAHATHSDAAQLQLDVAFRVIADHIRTLSFAIADGIQPGNTDRNYVLRRILRRAVRYGRTLGFHEPFFYKLVDVLEDKMGDVFPEIRAKGKHVQETIKREEEAFNKTLDRGIELFNEEAARLEGLRGSAPASGAADRALAVGTDATDNSGARYSKRSLPHFERPWGKYMVTFSTHQKRKLTSTERDLVLESILYAHNHNQYQLFVACVMPDHVHLLFEPQIKEEGKDGKPIFYSLGEILHGIKSTAAHRINKAANATGIHVWGEESFDRLMRTDSELEEKFHYICRNPWDNGVVPLTENYPWLWTPDVAVVGAAPEVSREGAGNGARGGRAPQNAIGISGDFAFRLYDTYGFPYDLTELMARERGLTVDKAGFDKLMEEQKTRARAAQKKEVIELSKIETSIPTKFTGFEHTEGVFAKVVEVFESKGKTGVILDTTPFYAEMGGQVGDTGRMGIGGNFFEVVATTKSGNTFLHFLESPHPEIPSDETVRAFVDYKRRFAIERHHTVTHLLHWALHEVVSKEASQKGSFVGPDKLTFDFNSAALEPEQISDIEKLVNEKILENAAVSWIEVPYADVKSRKDVMQFFGDKYGDKVRVVQIGGKAGELNGYSMELCGGTHTRATGEIGLFRIIGESAVAAGVRRIEAVAGLQAYQKAKHDAELISAVAGKVSSPIAELEKKIDALLAQQKELEKSLRTAKQKEAAGDAKTLLAKAETINGIPAIITNISHADGDTLQTIADALKSQFKGVIVLGGAANGAVSLVASVSSDFTAKVQAGKIIQAIAPIVGGKGGGKPDNARGGGKDTAKLDEALAKAKTLLG